MKNTLLVCLFALALHNAGMAQDPVADSTSVTPEQWKELYRKLEASLQPDDSELTGKIELISTNVDVYSLNQFKSAEKANKVQRFASTTKISIDSVEISISDGVIVGIRVYAGPNVFENEHKIALQNYSKVDEKVFIYLTAGNDSFLRLTDFIRYLPKLGQNFLPDDDDFVLKNTPDYRTRYLKSNVDLNSFVEVQIYSDFLSVFNNQPNGLIQTEAQARYLLYTVPSKNNIYFSNYIEGFLKFSKFDSQFKSVVISDTVPPHQFNATDRLLMNQYSFLNLGTKWNFAKVKYPRFLLELNCGVNYNLANVQFGASSETHSVDLCSYFAELRGGVLRSRNFGFNISLTALGQFILTRQLDVSRPTNTFYFSPEFSAFYHPKGNKLNKVFLRFRSFSQLEKAQYVTFQIGYASNIKLGK